MPPEPNKEVNYFGKTDYRNQQRLFGIRRKDRRQHMYVIGKTGTGKSTLLENLITQDIANGEGVCVVDPHGELVETVLQKIPEERLQDVVYFNPADPDSHMGFNILEIPDPQYKHLVASGLMGIFTKIWAGVWSARMEYILNNCILALLDNPGSTLLGIPRLLTDVNYRQEILKNVHDPVVKGFWMNEFEQWQERFRNEAIAPIQNKVGQFLSTALIRNIVGQSTSTLNIFDIMNTKKIFLVNVSKGRIGEDNSALLGAMIITKIQLHAMERVRIPEDQRQDFYLYVDEFQNFATDAFANILSEARKYRLNLTMAHQYIGQLVTDVSTKVRDAVFGNVGTMIIFRVGATDAEFLEKEFEPEFEIQDLVNIPNYHIYLKLMVGGVTCRPFSAETLAPFKVRSSPELIEQIIETSRAKYGRPRSVVEEDIRRWSGMTSSGSFVSAGPSGGGGGGGAGGGAGRSGGGDDEGKFPAVCSACQKSIMLPFAPTPGRPVYCRSCLAKIKSGEMAPIPKSKPLRTAVLQRGISDLANLGIEFQNNPEQVRENRPPARKDRPAPPAQRPAKPSTSSKLSLSALKPVEKTSKQKPKETADNIDALRQAISESLQRVTGENEDNK
jgi:CxxC-x17-CxxC domain-containing protein